MRKLPAWLRSHPIVSILLAVAALLTVAHFFLNWQAERRWQAYVQAGRARGVKFDLTEFAPPKIPGEENFAALPMLRAIMQPGAKSPMALPDKDRPNFGNALKGERLDWEKWRTFFKDAGFISETTDSAPRDVIRALEHYAPQFQEWSKWKTRPRCRFDLDLKAGVASIPFPHLGMFLDATKLFSLRGHANLSLSEPAEAYDDFRNGLQAYNAMAEEPTLIGGLVKIASLQVTISDVGDGLLTHSWTETELQKIAGDLAKIRIWEDYRSAFASERGFGNSMNDEYLAMSPWKRAREISAIPGLPGLSGPPIGFGFALLFPNRMFRDNQLRHNRYVDELLNRVNEQGTKYDPDGSTPSDADHLHGLDEFWFALFKVSAPVFSFIGQKFSFVQTRLEMAGVAVALQRFRIARGILPEKLTELVPDFIAALPDDIYSDKQMIYRRKENGGFFLYSVGPNRTDDGGITTDAKQSEVKQPDWVWPYR